MSVKLTNLSGHDIDVDDGSGGRLQIPAGQTVDYPGDIASDEVRQLLAGGQLKIEDHNKTDTADNDDDDDKPEEAPV
jgi:hypothetical protein